MNPDQIRQMVADGVSPREINERVMQANRARIDREIANGKWRCSGCGGKMQREKDSSILVCPRPCR